MNHPFVHAMLPDLANASSESPDDSLDPSTVIPVGDVVVRRHESGYGIFNYRGEQIIDVTMRTSVEAERLAAEIVSPWQGRVRLDTHDR